MYGMRQVVGALLIILLLAVVSEVQADPVHGLASKKRPQCSDGKDNDHDGRIDYPRDRGCTSRRDNSEKNVKKTKYPAGYGENVSLNGLQILPTDNPWNQDISGAAVDPNSDTLIASIGVSKTLFPAFGTTYEGAPNGIQYVVVQGSQKKKNVSFDYASESDAGPYPIPESPPIEGGPKSNGDRHILMIDRDNQILYELYYAFENARGAWSAGSGAIFDLNSNDLRPAGWTSADAAGLPIFPGLVRYDEVVEQGEITHALRFTANHTRRAYVSPARHYASSNTSASLPPMGMRVRLKASFDISGFPSSVQVILQALKKYGMFLADNGSDWFIAGSPNKNWNDDDLHTLRGVSGSDLEVVEMGSLTVGE